MHRLNTTSEGEMLVDEAELPITRSQYCDALDALRAASAYYPEMCVNKQERAA